MDTHSTDSINANWPGKWIAHETEDDIKHADELRDSAWIWIPFDRRHEPQKMANNDFALFRRTIPIKERAAIKSATLLITADTHYVVYLNGAEIGSGDNWRETGRYDIASRLPSGENLIAARVLNQPRQHENLRGGVNNPAGLIAKLTIETSDGREEIYSSDSAWRVNDHGPTGWMQNAYDDSEWQSAQASPVRGVESWTGEDAYSNRWYCYRKTIQIDKTPSSAVARIAVDSKYWLWINGELAVFEGGAKRGPDPQNTYFDTLDLAPYLREGDNQIALLAWYWGRSGFSHNDSGHHGLYFDLNLDEKWTVSDQSWKSSAHPAYGPSAPPHPNYRLSEFNIHFDARSDIGDWYSPSFDDSHWEPATELGAPPAAPWGKLVDRRIPQWSNSGLIAYENAVALPFVSDGELLEMKLPYNAQVTPYFKIKAPTGQIVDLRMDNYAGGSDQNIRTEYVTKEGLQEFETYAWMNGHKVEYRFPEGVEVLDLKYRETAFDAPVQGSFECDDPDLNELWKRSLRTLIVCMRDTYYDCPDRERAQWWGDAVIEIGQTFYALDRVSDTLTQKAIRELVDWQRPDATLFSPVPGGKWNAELPGQMLMSIGRFGFWLYYEFSGDEESIRYTYPSIKPYLELWQLDSDGLIANRQGDWYWGDWGTNKDTRILDNCYYYMALDGAKRMAELLGNSEDLPFYEERMRSIKENFDRVFWQGGLYRSPGYNGEIDDRGHGLAVLAGLANPENHEAIAKVLRENYQASPYIEKYVLEALFQLGRADQALERMKQRYRTHLQVPVTTLFEGWGIGSEGFGGGTINHSWSGGPLTLLSQYVAGVSPLEPGFKRFAVDPQLGKLKFTSVEIPTVYGKIASRIEISAKNVEQSLQVPEGTEAELTVPIGSRKSIVKILLNGSPITLSEDDLSTEQVRWTERGYTLTLCQGFHRVITEIAVG